MEGEGGRSWDELVRGRERAGRVVRFLTAWLFF